MSLREQPLANCVSNNAVFTSLRVLTTVLCFWVMVELFTMINLFWTAVISH